MRDDPEWLNAVAAYLELSDELCAKCDQSKAQLVSLASHAKEQGGAEAYPWRVLGSEGT